ncbi:DNA repair protein RAD51 homolog 2-like isoform X1 [Scylla paramamosain]|uniref:DNA repair protein RAD51 homolog 2-like isoform X1 n=2 Tax=Scylla paramamosain TaxID=85552 RepID=UPI00308334F7
MSYRKLSSLPLQEYVKSSLSKTSLRTVKASASAAPCHKDVLLLSPLTVMNMLHLSADQCKEFMDYLFSLCVPPKFTAYEMEEMEQHNNIPLGSKALDTLLHGGLLSGSLTEFVGPPGVGKTQWCLYITTKVLAGGRGGVHPSAIYIDTESAVRPERIVEMMTNKYPELSSEIPQFLSRIHMFRPRTATSMLEILDSLECIVVEKDARVVIVDSIASMAVSLSASSMQSKASQLSSWAAKLKSLAHQLNICVIVTNQITTVHKPQLPEPSSGVGPQPHPQEQVVDRRESVLNQEDRVVDAAAPVPRLPDHTECAIPALGNAWTHCITTRLILQYCTDSAARQIVIAKSPVSPFAIFSYIITHGGITIQEKDCCYSYSGPDPGQFRIRVQRGIPLDTA